jgi:ribosomal-protein-alanine N-acetyltransferase
MPDNTGSIKVLKKLGMAFVRQYQEEGYKLESYKMLLTPTPTPIPI